MFLFWVFLSFDIDDKRRDDHMFVDDETPSYTLQTTLDFLTWRYLSKYPATSLPKPRRVSSHPFRVSDVSNSSKSFQLQKRNDKLSICKQVSYHSEHAGLPILSEHVPRNPVPELDVGSFSKVPSGSRYFRYCGFPYAACLCAASPTV